MWRARSRTSEELEIVDERGIPVGRVTRPIDPRLFGPEQGTVYLERSLPNAEEPQHPPQAA